MPSRDETTCRYNLGLIDDKRAKRTRIGGSPSGDVYAAQCRTNPHGRHGSTLATSAGIYYQPLMYSRRPLQSAILAHQADPPASSLFGEANMEPLWISNLASYHIGLRILGVRHRIPGNIGLHRIWNLKPLGLNHHVRESRNHTTPGIGFGVYWN